LLGCDAVLLGAYIAALEGGTQEDVATLAQNLNRRHKVEALLKKLEKSHKIAVRWTPDMQEFKVNTMQLN
jgi:hypothetical protein